MKKLWRFLFYDWIEYPNYRYGNDEPTGYYKFNKLKLCDTILGIILFIALMLTIIY